MLLGLALVGATSIAACGDDSGSKSGTTAPAAAPAAIVISGSTFTVNAAKAGTITVRNDDSFDHTVTADDGSFDVVVPGGSTKTIEVAKAGSYPFHCHIHSSMKATLVVT
jgi:plastocyanin